MPQQEPIRVAQIMGRMMGGGVEATILNHYKFIDHSKVQFDFIVQDDSEKVPEELIKSYGGRIFTIPSYKKLPAYEKACLNIFRKTQPDIVHSNINALSIFPLYEAKKAGVKVRIAHSHSTANPREIAKTAIKEVLRPLSKLYPTHLAACGELSAEWLFGKRVVDQNKVQYIHNAIDLQKYSFNRKKRIDLRKSIGAGVSPIVGQIGRFSSQKNQEFSVEVFKELLKIIPNAKLVFLGIGDTMPAIKQKVTQLGIQASVFFMGSRDDAADWYSVFDVLLFPSLYEGLPLTAIEAQAAGLPIVASDQITEEAFIDNELVTVMPLKCSAHEWAQCLEATLEYAPRQSRISDGDTLRAAGYEIKDSARKLEAWYQSII
ncbi:glycosyl transferase [Bifidobacterium dolichotidis]|uniref:Glycosyl transferase n=1 Tax=Bifidobacterium dolichotidis TaxID=2306976 RepID=A0A430FRP8_9BIFI|nr:glycosyltransferase family 1 protein [Bifidobacterium dolichotidis]RSX55527.1 glycosyl transferase [Bifidobacterium dolichotidis]